MNTPPKWIAILTALLGSLMILRNLDTIIQQLRKILFEYGEYWRLRNEKQRQEIEERRLRIAFWASKIQSGHAEETLRQLEKGMDKQW